MPRPYQEPRRVKLSESTKSLRYLPRFFRQVSQSSPIMFYSNIIARLASAGFPVALLWVGKLIIDEIVSLQQTKSDDLNQLWVWIGLEYGLIILSDILNRLISLTDGLLGDQYSIYSSILLIRKTADLQLSQLEDSETYDMLERARRQTTNRISLMSNILSQVQDIIIIVSLIGGLIAFEPWLIVLLILSVIPSIANEIKFSGTSYSLARSWTQERREMDYLRYIGASDVTAKEVKLFGLADYLSNRFETISKNYYLANRALAISRSVWGLIFTFLGTLAYYGAYILIAMRTVAGILTLGDLTFLSGSFNRLKSKLTMMFYRFTSITESSLYLQDYFDYIDLGTEEQEDIIPLPNQILKGFQFIDVGFKYPGTDKWVVRHLNFTLKAGEKLALVGENGAGKTTLTKLLLRFYDPTEGMIMLDGTDIRKFKRADYQQMFGVIFQDFVKYDLSYRENVAVGNIDEIDNEEKIKKASNKSLADEVVDNFPNGYDQQLGKRFKDGKELSGGQWQKVALARAYMKDAEVLILDEPTSALDARAEYEAFQRFIGLTEGKTAVIISHRFSTVRMADRILVLENGKIEELGTHEELLANNKLYAELFNLQAAGYQ